MKEIILTRGLVALVDDDDYEKFKFLRWYASYDDRGDNFIAAHNVTLKDGSRKTLYLHREVLGLSKGEEVDHINHNTLDNRKENLRRCTHAENMMNRKVYKNNKTGFKGVSWHKSKKKFGAGIRALNKKYFLGYFDIAQEAARAYNDASKKYHGDFGSLNRI